MGQGAGLSCLDNIGQDTVSGRPAWRERAVWRQARREALGLSREAIAARLGVSVKRFGMLERGVNRPGDVIERAWDAALFKEIR